MSQTYLFHQLDVSIFFISEVVINCERLRVQALWGEGGHNNVREVWLRRIYLLNRGLGYFEDEIESRENYSQM